MKINSRIYAFILLTILSAASPVILSIVPLRAQEAQTASPQPEMTPGMVPESAIPFYAEWAASPHADRSAQAFKHWDPEGAVPATCAKCHSTPGFRDFVGADGTPAGVVDQPALSAPWSPVWHAITTQP